MMHPGGVKTVASLLRGQGVLQAVAVCFAAQESPPLGWRGQLVGVMPPAWGGPVLDLLAVRMQGWAGEVLEQRGGFVCAAGKCWTLGFGLQVRLPEKSTSPYGRQRSQKAAAGVHPGVHTNGCCWSHRFPGRAMLADTQAAPRRRGAWVIFLMGLRAEPCEQLGTGGRWSAELCWGLCKESLPLQLTGGRKVPRGYKGIYHQVPGSTWRDRAVALIHGDMRAVGRQGHPLPPQKAFPLLRDHRLGGTGTRGVEQCRELDLPALLPFRAACN